MAERLRRHFRRLRRTSAGFVTIGLICTVVSAMVLTLFGLRAIGGSLDIFDGNVWLSSSASGSTQRANVNSGKVDMRYTLKDARNHDLAVAQTDNNLLLHDRTTGIVTSVNLSTLSSSASLSVPPGAGSSVAMWKNRVVLVDSAQGTIQRLNPDNLTSKSPPLHFTPGFLPGGFDNDGRYWLASTTEGAAIAVIPDENSMQLRVDQKVSATKPNHRLKLTVLNQGAAVIDETDDAVIVIKGNQTRRIAVPNLDSSIITARTTSSTIAITVPNSREIVLLDGDSVHGFTVDGTGPLGEAAVFAGQVYVADSSATQVLELDISGKVKNRIATADSGGAVSLEQREGVLVINEPRGPAGYLVSKTHQITKITKYTDGGAGPEEDTVASNGPKQKAPTPTTAPPQPQRQADRPSNASAPPNAPPTGNSDTTPPRSSSTSNPAPSPSAPRNDKPRVPAPPVLKNARGGDGQITLDYYPPNDTGGAKLEAIDIYCNGSRVIHDVHSGSGKQNASFPARNNVACTLQGYAINSAGSSAAALGGAITPRPISPAPQPSPAPSPIPLAPTGVRAALTGGQNVQITWNAVTVPAGSTLDNYVVFQCDENALVCVRLFSTKNTNYTVNERSANPSRGRFKVAAVIDGKESAPSAPSNAVSWR
ncbi:MAG: hypothetical protein DLM55_12175 [Acidimicrobiales bacterium]|nr:MAG: hypothetical protein DLM55_12175 [Acidimicrobiales bacterium]